MKRIIPLLLGILALSATSCSTTRCGHSLPGLAGNWKMGGPYNVGKPCRVLQEGTDVTFINEMGDKSDGILIARRSEVIALDWEGGLRGLLTDHDSRISWRNGTFWLKTR
jgi:hypothetical protein